MLTGFHLEQKIRGLGYQEIAGKNRRDFARMIIDRSRLFQNSEERSWVAAFQARSKESQIVIASYPQSSRVEVKSVTKYDLMQNGLMNKSYDVTENYLLGVLLHPSLAGFGETRGRLRRRNFFSHWFYGRSKWRFVLAPKSPALSTDATTAIAAILNFLNQIPVAETELADGMFCFTHKHLENHADIPLLASELKKLAAELP